MRTQLSFFFFKFSGALGNTAKLFSGDFFYFWILWRKWGKYIWIFWSKIGKCIRIFCPKKKEKWVPGQQYKKIKTQFGFGPGKSRFLRNSEYLEIQ